MVDHIYNPIHLILLKLCHRRNWQIAGRDYRRGSPPEIDPAGLDLYKKIDLELRTKYVKLPEIEGWHGYNDKQAYIDQEEDSTLARKLNRSIQGKGAFGRFKEVLYQYPGQIEEWYHFEAMHQFERIREWLHEVDLELELII